MSSSNNYVVIMAGGIGSRFWPSSRSYRPKQFLDILGLGQSLIQLTYNRFRKICPATQIFILTNEMYKEQVIEHLPELPSENILCEPSRNNTAPCVAYACFKLHNINPNANFIIAPSDHVILKEDKFIDKITTGLNFVAKHQSILTLGIKPSYANTGYGYINFNQSESIQEEIFKVKQFTEKPNLEKAQVFFEGGEHLWNAGIFLSTTKAMLKAYQEHAEEIYSIFERGLSLFNTDKENDFIKEYYPMTPDISIDYAIMEKAENIYTLPADIGWSDLGTWGSLYQELPKNEANNVLSSDQKELIKTIDTSNCLIRSPKDKLVVIKGLDDYIVVDEDNILLIYPKSKEQEIKAVTKNIAKDLGDKFL